MRIYRYWARARCDQQGRPDDAGFVTGVGWSDRSEHEAAQMAQQRARQAAEQIGGGRGWADWAYYPDRPMQEPVVDELKADGRVIAAITRNAYGCFVLNAAEVMFVDIDDPEKPALGGLIGKLFGRKPEPAKDDIPAHVAGVAQADGGLTVRLYRTAGGYRGIVVNQLFNPTSAQTTDLLNAFGSDGLYIRLCTTQECFRARLTPKPWRCGMRRPPCRYPWEGDSDRLMFEDWSKRYEKTIADYTVCQYLETIGNGAVHPAVEPVLKMHDELTCAGSGKLA